MNKTRQIAILLSPLTSLNEEELDFFINNRPSLLKLKQEDEQFEEAQFIHIQETLVDNKDYYYQFNSAGMVDGTPENVPDPKRLKEAAWAAAKRATGFGLLLSDFYSEEDNAK